MMVLSTWYFVLSTKKMLWEKESNLHRGLSYWTKAILWSTHIQCLSHDPHPRDKRAWLPVSSPHNVVGTWYLVLRTKYPKKKLWGKDSNLHGAVSEDKFLDKHAARSESYPVCSRLPTPETRGHGCQFHHLTMLWYFVLSTKKSAAFNWWCDKCKASVLLLQIF